MPTSRATRVTSAANERELIHHRVDGVLQLEDLALDIDGDLLGEVAVGHGGGDLGDVAHLAVRLPAMKLTLSVRSFQVPATPLTSAWPPSLPSVPTSRATRVTSAANEAELIDHRVDGVLQLQDLALDVDGDLLGEVAVGDGGGHLGDVAHLAGQVAGHEVDAVGQVLPGAGHALARRPGRPACPSVPTSRATRVTSAANERS